MKNETHKRLMKLAIAYNEIEAASDKRFIRLLLAKGAITEIEAEIMVSRKKGDDFFNIDDDTVKALKNAIEEFYAISGKVKESILIINQLKLIISEQSEKIQDQNRVIKNLNDRINFT